MMHDRSTPTWLIAFTLVVLSLFSSRAYPAEASRVLLISMKRCCPNRAWPAAEARLLTELRAAAIPVSVISGVATGAREQQLEMAVLADDRRAVSAVRIARASTMQTAPGTVDLWVRDPETRQTRFRHFELQEGSDPRAASMGALRALEALRAGIQEVQIVGKRWPRAVDTKAPRSQPPVPLVQQPSSLAARFGLGGVGGIGGTGVQLALALGLEWMPLPMLGVGVEGSLSVAGPALEANQGSASFDVVLVRTWAHWHILHSGWWRPSVGIGGGVLHARTTGKDTVVFEGAATGAVAAYAGLDGRLALAFSRYVSLAVDFRVGVCLPEVRVRFGGEAVADFGLPVFDGGLWLIVRP